MAIPGTVYTVKVHKNMYWRNQANFSAMITGFWTNTINFVQQSKIHVIQQSTVASASSNNFERICNRWIV